MKNDKRQKSSIMTKIAIGVVVLFFVIMFGISIYKDVIYKDYKTIHSEIDPDMPGYEIPIAKNVELVNNRVSDGIAYDKYNYTPDKYARLVKELEKDEEKAEEDKHFLSDCLSLTSKEYGLGYKLSYEIISAERVEVEEADRDKGVTDMYVVEFRVALSVGGEEKGSSNLEYEIAEVDGSWIFYTEGYRVYGFYLVWPEEDPAEK